MAEWSTKRPMFRPIELDPLAENIGERG